MTAQVELFAAVLPASRNTDPETSHRGARVAERRAPSQQARLLLAFADEPDGLTARGAGLRSGLADLPTCGYWKRVSELARDGLISQTGEQRRHPDGGEYQMVYTLTDKGRMRAESLRVV